jgi:1,2-diacylglycerol-3-alpha-glucose alpha-1,2-glucosyltransferase
MKILLYIEAEQFLSRSGIGRAISHQRRALDISGIQWTQDPNDDWDIVHLNTYGIQSWNMLRKAKKAGKKVIFHGHSTEEDFRDSFVGSNLVSPIFKWYLMHFYRRADLVVTPTDYSADILRGYGIKCPILPVSNGIDLKMYTQDTKKEELFRQYFNITADEKVVICAGLYFRRKGIDEFVKVAEKMPDVRFIWFGYQNLWTIPGWIRRIIKKNHPKNVLFPGYIKGEVFEGAMTAADAFFFPSREETEGIVVLEALASKQKVLVRDIPVYKGWLDKNSASMANDVDGFVSELRKILDGKVDKTDVGYEVAQSRSIENSAADLAAAYRQTMEL